MTERTFYALQKVASSLRKIAADDLQQPRTPPAASAGVGNFGKDNPYFRFLTDPNRQVAVVDASGVSVPVERKQIPANLKNETLVKPPFVAPNALKTPGITNTPITAEQLYRIRVAQARSALKDRFGLKRGTPAYDQGFQYLMNAGKLNEKSFKTGAETELPQISKDLTESLGDKVGDFKVRASMMANNPRVPRGNTAKG